MILSNFKLRKDIKYFLADNKLININTLPKKDRNLGKLNRLGKIIYVHLTTGSTEFKFVGLKNMLSLRNVKGDFNTYATYLKLVDIKCSINTHSGLSRNQFYLCLCRVILSYQQHWLNDDQVSKLNTIYDNYLSNKDTDMNNIGSELFIKEILENKIWE